MAVASMRYGDVRMCQHAILILKPSSMMVHVCTGNTFLKAVFAGMPVEMSGLMVPVVAIG